MQISGTQYIDKEEITFVKVYAGTTTLGLFPLLSCVAKHSIFQDELSFT